MGACVAGPVSAIAGAVQLNEGAVGLNHNLPKKLHSPSLRPALAAPLLTWTSHTRTKFRRLIAAGWQSTPRVALCRIGLPGGEFGARLGDSAAQSSHSFRCRPRRSFQSSGIFLTAARGEYSSATAIAEEPAAVVEDSKVSEASVATRSLWRLLSLITTLFVCRLQWPDGVCTRGQEYMQPRFERLKMRSEPLRYWAFISCLLFCWLSVAFFLHWQVQRWEMNTTVLAHPQGATDGEFDPGGSLCHSLWPGTGLGCQIYIPAT